MGKRTKNNAVKEQVKFGLRNPWELQTIQKSSEQEVSAKQETEE